MKKGGVKPEVNPSGHEQGYPSEGPGRSALSAQLGRPSELPDGQHEHIVQHAAALQIKYQGGNQMIEQWQ